MLFFSDQVVPSPKSQLYNSELSPPFMMDEKLIFCQMFATRGLASMMTERSFLALLPIERVV